MIRFHFGFGNDDDDVDDDYDGDDVDDDDVVDDDDDVDDDDVVDDDDDIVVVVVYSELLTVCDILSVSCNESRFLVIRHSSDIRSVPLDRGSLGFLV